MTYKQIAEMIEDIGLPFTYYSFPNDVAPEPPYIVFNYPQRDDFAADNVNYVKIDSLTIELYTATKDFQTEQMVEAALTENGLFYTKEQTYIRAEHLYQLTYVCDVITD